MNLQNKSYYNGKMIIDTPPPSIVAKSIRIFPHTTTSRANTDNITPSFWQFVCSIFSPSRNKVQDNISEFEKYEKRASQHAILEKKLDGCHIPIRQNDDELSDENSIAFPDPNKSEKIKPKLPSSEQTSTRMIEKCFTAKASTDNSVAPSPVFSTVEMETVDALNKFDNVETSISSSRYPLFYIKGARITPQDCVEIKKSWQLVVDEKLAYFKHMKECNMIPMSKSSVSWFYDVFYESVYTYDVNNNSNMCNIFKHNLKIQAHALMVIINNCINIAQKYSLGEKFDYRAMHKAHDVLEITYKHYLIISELLLATFDRCLREQWTKEMEIAWCKLVSRILKDIMPHYKFKFTKLFSTQRTT